MEWLTIGQMAKTNSISEQTLRLYDKEGLLKPIIRGENGYRYYDIRQNARLDMIQYLKSLGLSLKCIKSQLSTDNLDSIMELLEKRCDDIAVQQQQLQSQLKAVVRTIKSFENYRNAPPDGTITLERFEKRLMYCIDSGVNFYDYGLETYEKVLRTLKTSLCENHVSPLYFSNAGTILRKKMFENREFVSTEVFVFVDYIDNMSPVQTIPAGNYLCIYCDSFEKEKQYACHLLDEIKKLGYTIGGDYICEAMADLPVVESTTRGMFLRLQVPIFFC